MSNMQERVDSAMASARETAANVGEKVSDFFQGNPFQTPVGRKIEMATDATQLATENWGLNMEICDYINHTQDGGKDAIRAIRKRLHTQMSKNNAIVMYTLTVLETCVKNCDHRFHVLVCQKEFIQDLVKIIGPKFDAPQIVQERVLSLIQAWSDTFRGQSDLAGVSQVYDDLKAKGVEFPATDLDHLAPILTPQRTVFTEEPQQSSPRSHTASVQTTTNVNPEHYEQPMQADPSHGVRATPEELIKLRSELDVVNSNIKVFREMLTETSPGQATADELQLLKELDDTCKEMQKRVLSLIAYLTNDEVIHELLVVNDELNSVFDKYGRFLKNRELEENGMAAKVQAEREKVKDLIDLDGPAPASSSTTVTSSVDPDGYTVDQKAKMSYEEIKRLGLQPLPIHLESLSLSDRPTASIYAANAEPQADVGLRTAAHNKTTPVKEREAQEMEQWLKAQEGSESKSKEDVENEKL